MAFRYHKGNKSKVGPELQFIHCGKGELSRSESGLGSQIVWTPIPDLHFPGCVTMALTPHPPWSQFLHVQNGDNYGAVV